MGAAHVEQLPCRISRWRTLLAAFVLISAVPLAGAAPPLLGECDDIAHKWLWEDDVRNVFVDAAGTVDGQLSANANIVWVSACSRRLLPSACTLFFVRKKAPEHACSAG